jgi:AbrB family looped-hinge helix DNA binding protein
MQATIDQAGRLVIPKQLRDHVGLRPGPVDVTVEGSGLHIEPQSGDELQELDGMLVIGPGGATVTDEQVRALRHAGQR